MENLDFAEQFQIFDLFSGESKISSVALLGLHIAGREHSMNRVVSAVTCTKLRHSQGYSVATYDMIYGPEMDFLKCGGYSYLVHN